MFKNLLTKIAGSDSEKALARLAPLVEKCAKLEPEYSALSEDALRGKTAEFRARLEQGETLDDLMPEAFAAVREASRRANNMRHYDVQLVGGALLHQGKIAEMRTGEGKTLVATCPLYLNALAGDGAHLVTQNDYLAKRDAQWMGRVYHALGMTTGIIQSAGDGRPDESTYVFDPAYPSTDDRLMNLRPVRRRDAYACDITYGTNNEYGFDYLRDNMTQDLAECVQRVRDSGQPLLAYAVIDEVDNLLIDEARTPLIISGPADEPSGMYGQFAQLVKRLTPSANNDPKEPDGDYIVEAKTKNVTMTEDGVRKMEKLIGVENLYAESADMLPYLDNALRAHVVYEKDRDYVISEKGEIIIVDEFTGRMMYGRRFSEGLHQAIEAKEGVKVQRESLTYATITFQNFFRMYDNFGGMTGTAMTEAEEFFKIYQREVVPLPTNIEFQVQQKKLIEQKEKFVDGSTVQVFVEPKGGGRKYFRRLDYPDLVYKDESAKYKAVVEEIAQVSAGGRPVLVGTISIDASERLSRMLHNKGVRHEVLNAKQHEREATIIAQAGRSGSVTIATNMAGRGVDILLGGNPEGIARDKLRREGRELVDVTPDEWGVALTAAEGACREDKVKVQTLGGLHVIGTERHEARRIDNQLRGRCSRQGDPGSTRFYVSLDDELMRRFGGERVKGLMERMKLEDDVPMEYGILSKSIEQAQEKVEGYNFDVRKHVIQYDDVINKQREVIYAQRRTILEKDDLKEVVLNMVGEEIEDQVKAHTPGDNSEDWDVIGLSNEVAPIVHFPRDFDPENFRKGVHEDIIEQLEGMADVRYSSGIKDTAAGFLTQAKLGAMTFANFENGRDILSQAVTAWGRIHIDRQTYLMLMDTPLAAWPQEAAARLPAVFFDAMRLVRDRSVMIQAVDQLWVRHLTDLEELREGIGLRAYGQRDPLVAYRTEASGTFDSLIAAIRNTIAARVFNVQLNVGANPPPAQRQVRPPTKPAVQRSLKPAARKLADDKSTVAKVEPPKAVASPITNGVPAGIRIAAGKLGRNDVCPYCTTGKKLKHCDCEGARRFRGEI